MRPGSDAEIPRPEARRGYTAPTLDHLTAAAPERNSAMIALKPRPGEAAAIADPDGEPADTLHVTLCFLGEIDGDLAPIAAALATVAATHAPLEGVVGGYGRFQPPDVGILLPDVPGLTELRVAVTQALAEHGIDYSRIHGFQPHISVDALPEHGEMEDMLNRSAQAPLHFDEILVVRGDVEVIPLPLTGSRPLTASIVDNWLDAPDDLSKTAIPAEYHYRPSTGEERCYSCSYFGSGTVGRCGMFDTPVERDYVCDEWADGIPEEALTAAVPPWTPPSGDELVNVTDLVHSLRTKTDPVREAFLRAVMSPALRDAGINFDVTNPLTAQAFASTGQHITSIAETTQLNVMRIIRESYTQGLSIPETAKAIQVGMKAASLQRATMIARTEMVGAVSAGALAATRLVEQQTGDEYVKVWMTAPGAMYPRHEDYEGLDGQTVRTGAPFEVGAAMLMYPGDPTGPPGEVINCRCSLSFKSAEDAANEMAGIDSGGIAGPPMVPPPSDTVSVGAGPFLSRAALSKIGRLGLDAPLKDLKPTSEVGQQVYATAKDTQHLYSSVGPSGTYDDAIWTPERKALHDAIIAKVFEGKIPNLDEQIRAYFTAGGGASGKSAAVFDVNGKDIGLKALGARPDVIHIDPDVLKEMLPEYGKLRDAGDFYAASGVHEESSMLAKAITAEAQKRGFSVIIDTTGSSSTFPAKIAEMARKGYEIQVSMFSTPTNEAIARSLKRGAKRGRYVALEALKGAHAGASRELGIWKDLKFVKEWRVWDNTGVTPKLVAEGGAGQPATVYDEANWERILAKGAEGGGGRALPIPPPISLPTTAEQAAQRFVDGVATNEIYAGKLVDTNALAKAQTNWVKHLDGNIVTDNATLQKVEDADAYNRESKVYTEQLATHGRDVAIVVKDSTPATNPISPGNSGERAARITGNRVTVLSESALAATGTTGVIVPGTLSASTEGGLSATLRHEYGHQIDAGLTAEERQTFREALPDLETIQRDLTKYSGFRFAPGNADEAFAELFAVVSDPAYNPAEWAPWVRDLGHRFFGAPTEGLPTESAPALVPARETVATLVPGPGTRSLREFTSSRDPIIERFANARGETVQEYKDKLDFMVADAVADAPVAIRVDSKALAHVLEDGRFKTQFETKTSGGSLAPSTRANAEQIMFGYPKNLPVEKRPVYGYLEGSTPEGGWVDQYGDTTVRLKDDVRDRTTFTLNDSLGPALDHHLLPTPLTDPNSNSITMDIYKSDPLKQGATLEDISSFYAEAQIHGGVTVNDIEEVVLNKYYLGAAQQQARSDIVDYEHWVEVAKTGRDAMAKAAADPNIGAEARAKAADALRGHEATVAQAEKALAAAQETYRLLTTGPTPEERLDALGIKYRYR